MLDADQELDAGSRAELRQLVQTSRTRGYMLRQLNYVDRTGNASILEHGVVRLFPNLPAIKYVGAVHEQIVSLDPVVPFTLASCGVILHHEGFRPQHRDVKANARRDVKILKLMYSNDPDNAFTSFNLGQSCQILEQPEEAARWFAQCVALAELPQEGNDLPSYILNARMELSRCLLTLGRLAEALVVAQEAVEQAPTSPDAHAVLGAAYTINGQLDDALNEYLTITQLPPAEIGAPADRSLSTWRGLLGLGQVLVLQKRRIEALEVLEQAWRQSNGHESVSPWLEAAQQLN